MDLPNSTIKIWKFQTPLQLLCRLNLYLPRFWNSNLECDLVQLGPVVTDSRVTESHLKPKTVESIKIWKKWKMSYMCRIDTFVVFYNPPSLSLSLMDLSRYWQLVPKPQIHLDWYEPQGLGSCKKMHFDLQRREGRTLFLMYNWTRSGLLSSWIGWF